MFSKPFNATIPIYLFEPYTPFNTNSYAFTCLTFFNVQYYYRNAGNIFLALLAMEKCFAYFGMSGKSEGIAGSLGLNDEQMQLNEIRDIETTMPDAKIIMIEPNPMGKIYK